MFNMIFFCEKCFLRNIPDESDKCLIYDKINNRLLLINVFRILKHLNKPMTKGFTPHLVQFVSKYEENNTSKIECIMSCEVCDIDSEIKKNSHSKKDNNFISFQIINYRRYIIDASQWLDIIKNQLF